MNITDINICLDEFLLFIVNAKKNGYAAHRERASSSRLASKDYEYREKDFCYRDSYFGSLYDLGQEIIWYREIPIWGMSYYGGMKPEWRSISEEIFIFLRDALANVEPSLPFRGPSQFSHRNLKYINNVTGNIEMFMGDELILSDDIIVYNKIYHGGIILGKNTKINLIT